MSKHITLKLTRNQASAVYIACRNYDSTLSTKARRQAQTRVARRLRQYLKETQDE